MKSRSLIGGLAAALLILTAAACGTSVGTTTSATSATTAPPTPVTADEYDVYSALIQSVYIDASRPKLMVISETTINPNQEIKRAPSVMKSSWPDLGDDILGDFKAKNQTSSVLERAFTLSVPYTLMTEQDVASIFSSSATGWDKFYAKYPDAKGRLTLSRVGFNQAKDTAVLYTEYGSGLTAGEGDVVLMKKTEGRWTVQDKGMFWTA